MTKDELLNELHDLFDAVPICMREPCNATRGILCFDEEDCINNKLRKLINKIKKEN